MKTLLATTTLALAVPAVAAAHDYTVGDLQIIHPRIFETSATAKAGGGYVTIANNGGTADALTGVDADFPKVMLHESYEEDGVMRMQHVDAIAVPADGIAELAPGGYHVMFMGLSEPFEAGDEVPVTLTFEKAGEVEVDFKVIERTGEH
jgi:copper(I)-binding protein